MLSILKDKNGKKTKPPTIPYGTAGEPFPWLKLSEDMEVPAGAELHDKARLAPIVDVCIERGKEGVIEDLEDLTLCRCPVELVPLRQGPLVHDLHGIV